MTWLRHAAGMTGQLGSRHVFTLLAKMNLANVLHNQGNLAAAKEFYETVIADYTGQRGPQVVSIFDATIDLAIRVEKQGDLAAAIELYETRWKARQTRLDRSMSLPSVQICSSRSCL